MLAKTSPHKESASAVARRTTAPSPQSFFAPGDKSEEVFTSPKFSWTFGDIRMSPPAANGDSPAQGDNGSCALPMAGLARPLPRPMQAKLNVGAVDDPLEREADRVAEQVMRMPEPAGLAPVVSEGSQEVLPPCACGGSCEKCKSSEAAEEPIGVAEESLAGS